MALDRLDCSADTRVGRGQETDERHHQEARIKPWRSVELHERSNICVVPVPADFLMDRFLSLQVYGSESATSSAGTFCAPTATTMYCLPFAMYVMGFPHVFAGSSSSCTTAPVILSYA